MQKSLSTFTSTFGLFVQVLAVEITRRSVCALLLRGECTHTFSLRASLLLIAVKFALRDWSFCHLPGASGSLFNSTFPSFPSPLCLFLALSESPSPVPLIFSSNSYNSSDSSRNLVHYYLSLSLSVLIKQRSFYSLHVLYIWLEDSSPTHVNVFLD